MVSSSLVQPDDKKVVELQELRKPELGQSLSKSKIQSVEEVQGDTEAPVVAADHCYDRRPLGRHEPADLNLLLRENLREKEIMAMEVVKWHPPDSDSSSPRDTRCDHAFDDYIVIEIPELTSSDLPLDENELETMTAVEHRSGLSLAMEKQQQQQLRPEGGVHGAFTEGGEAELTLVCTRVLPGDDTLELEFSAKSPTLSQANQSLPQGATLMVWNEQGPACLDGGASLPIPWPLLSKEVDSPATSLLPGDFAQHDQSVGNAPLEVRGFSGDASLRCYLQQWWVRSSLYMQGVTGNSAYSHEKEI